MVKLAYSWKIRRSLKFLEIISEGIIKQHGTFDKKVLSRSPTAWVLLLAQIYRAEGIQSINHSSNTGLPAVDFKIKFWLRIVTATRLCTLKYQKKRPKYYILSSVVWSSIKCIKYISTLCVGFSGFLFYRDQEDRFLLTSSLGTLASLKTATNHRRWMWHRTMWAENANPREYGYPTLIIVKI